MKYNIDVHEFSFNKIKNGQRKIALHLFDKLAQKIKIYDVLDMRNMSTNEHLECKVLGIGIFDNFDDLVNSLGAEALGYGNKEEVLVRLARIYPAELQKHLSVVAFFLERVNERVRRMERGEIER